TLVSQRMKDVPVCRERCYRNGRQLDIFQTRASRKDALRAESPTGGVYRPAAATRDRILYRALRFSANGHGESCRYRMRWAAIPHCTRAKWILLLRRGRKPGRWAAGGCRVGR